MPMTALVRWQYMPVLGLTLLLLGCDLSPAQVTEPTGAPIAPLGTQSAYPPPPIGPYPFASPLATLSRTAVPPADSPVPEVGKASLTGILYSITQGTVIPGTQYYLRRVPTDTNSPLPLFSGPEESEGDIAATTDLRAYVILNNIPPGDYYLAVWDVYSWIPAITTKTDPKPLVMHLDANQRKALGVIYVPWP
jgi:hypothetical protein